MHNSNIQSGVVAKGALMKNDDEDLILGEGQFKRTCSRQGVRKDKIALTHTSMSAVNGMRLMFSPNDNGHLN